jgi:hypothetical protein
VWERDKQVSRKTRARKRGIDDIAEQHMNKMHKLPTTILGAKV